MYPLFLQAGYLPNLFWESTIPEIIDLINSFNKREEIRQMEALSSFKFNAICAWNHAIWISQVINGDGKEHTVYDYFPELFKDELEDIEKQKRINAEAKYKAQMIDFANRFNNKRKKEENQ